jgi:hypothetical protein
VIYHVPYLSNSKGCMLDPYVIPRKEVHDDVGVLWVVDVHQSNTLGEQC